MKIFISAGDPSGDLHGANLIKKLKKQNPQIDIWGFGGSQMASVANILDKIADDSIIGFWEPIKNLSRLNKNLAIAKKVFSKEKPSVLVLIDYYGFNIHLAGVAKECKIPVIYYVCPQIWATRKGRIQVIKKLIRKALVIFPFEKEIYKKAGIDCEFVGHPLLDIIPNQPINQSTNQLIIGLMPGSRIQEINRHFIPFYKASQLIAKEFNNMNLNLIIPVFSDKIKNYIINNFKINYEKIEFVLYSDYEKRSKMDICITSSGTATVENMILKIPMVIAYKTSFLTYIIAKTLINIQNIGMVNILAEKTICPELIQNDVTPENIAKKCIEILKNKSVLKNMQQEFAEVTKKLGGKGATKKAAEIILKESENV